MGRGTQLPKSGASVLIADDHPLFLLGLRTFLEQAKSYRVVAAAGSADEVLRYAAKTSPDIVIVDLSIVRHASNSSSNCESYALASKSLS